MNNLTILTTVCFIAMASPGPDFLLVTKNALSYPRRQGLATAFGIVSGCLFHASYCILGLALIITKSVIAFSVIKFAGAGYLIYIGIKSITSKHADEDLIHIEKVSAKLTTFQAFAQGFLCNVLNPKLAVFLLSLFTQFISANATTLEKSTVAGIFVLESAIYWPVLVMILQFPAIRRFFADTRVLVDRTCGALLIYLGLRVALSHD